MKNSLKTKLTKSFVGRVVRRLLGEEKGQAMMEYIVVALLIAAACIIGVALFGHTITGMFASLSYSVAGDPTKADTEQTNTIKKVDDKKGSAQDYNSHKRDGSPSGNVAY